MNMRPAARMQSSKVGAFTAVLSLVLTVASVAMAYLAIHQSNTFNIRDGFLAIFGLLLVISVNS